MFLTWPLTYPPRSLADRRPVVRISRCNQGKDLNLRSLKDHQLHEWQVPRDFRMEYFFPARTARIVSKRSFRTLPFKIYACARGLHRPLAQRVARVGRQHNDPASGNSLRIAIRASIRSFLASQVHQSDVGRCDRNCSDGLAPIRRFANQKHILLMAMSPRLLRVQSVVVTERTPNSVDSSRLRTAAHRFPSSSPYRSARFGFAVSNGPGKHSLNLYRSSSVFAPDFQVAKALGTPRASPAAPVSGHTLRDWPPTGSIPPPSSQHAKENSNHCSGSLRFDLLGLGHGGTRFANASRAMR